MPNFDYQKFLDDWYNFNPNIKISPKNGIAPTSTNDLVDCHCELCGDDFEQTPKYLRIAIKRKPKAKGCKNCISLGVRNMKESFYTLEVVNSILKENNPQITILEELPDHNLKCHCSRCNQIFIQGKYATIHSKSCPICYGKIVIPGLNDLKTTDPKIAAYFTSEEYITTHTANTHEKGEVKCPDCGATKMMIPKNLRSQGFGCLCCSDGISYPNKFIRQLIRQLPVENIIDEYSPEWIKPKRYDVYFEYNKKKYIVEMDGEFHYKESSFNNLQETKEHDEIKNKLAKEHSIKIIRIKALESNQEYLKQQILNSELNTLIDLSSVDWNKCDEIASSSLLKIACEIYSSTTKSSYDIANELGVSQSSILKYLNKGTQLNLCNYITQDGNNRSRNRTIYVLDKNKKLLFISSCVKEAFKKLKQMYTEIHFVYCTGLECIKNKKEYLGFYFLRENEYNNERRFFNEYSSSK